LAQYGYGTLSKLYSYSNIEEEYIHFDIDYFLFNKLRLNDTLICRHSESREKVGETDFNKAYSGLIEKLKINYTDFGFNVINENYVMNMCVFGVPKNHHAFVCDYFKKLNEYTQQNIESIYNTHLKELPPHWAIEQYIPAQFFLENNINIEELNDYENFQIRKQFDYIRLYEMKDFSLVNSVKLKDVNIKQVLTNYMSKNIGHHLWISKNVSNVDELLINVIKEMYPELYKKINLILGIKENNNKTFI
jgi:predicted DNA-binding protein YlxM (UPF0122 family)